MFSRKKLVGFYAVVACAVTAPAKAQAVPFVFDAPRSTDSESAIFVGENSSSSKTLLEHNAEDPAIASDQSTVAWIRHSETGKESTLYVEPKSGGGESAVRELSCVFCGGTQLADPNFSADGSQLAYGCEEYYVGRPPGPEGGPFPDADPCKGQLEVAFTSGAAASGIPVSGDTLGRPYLSNDGARVLYDMVTERTDTETGYEPSKHEIFDADLDGLDPSLLVAGDDPAFSLASSPALSPDGSRIAFTGSMPGGDADIFVFDIATSEITHLFSTGSQPTWKPNGRAIAYIQDSDAKEINLETSAVTTLVDAPFDAGGDTYERVTSVEYPRKESLDAFARKFRPDYYFDSAEDNRPLNVEGFFQETLGGSPLHEVCDSSGCSPLTSVNDLRAHPGSDAAPAHIHVGQVEGEYTSPYPECNVDFDDCNDGPRTAVYYNVLEPDSEAHTFVSYWNYYRNNNFPRIGGGSDHQSDWEGVILAFSDGTESETFDYALLSQHKEWYRYLRGTLRCDGGTAGSCGTEGTQTGQHLSSFVVNGAHANYPDSCEASTNLIPDCAQTVAFDDGFGKGLGVLAPGGEGGHDGQEPWGENGVGSLTSTLPLPEADGWGPLDDKNWTDWPGYWGDEDYGVSPGSRDIFTEPDEHYNCAADESSVENFLASTKPCAEVPEPPEPPIGTQTKTRCPNWMGYGVSVLACSNQALSAAEEQARLGEAGTYGLSLSQRHTIANAPGITQAVGPALNLGDEITASGVAPAGTTVTMRVLKGSGIHELAFPPLPTNSPLRLTWSPALGFALKPLLGPRLVPAAQVRVATLGD